MRWFALRMLALWVLFITIIGAVIIIGRQQPTSPHIAIFHLTDCQLPCWIGIIPGKSTISEAREQIKRVYGDPQKYTLYDDGSNQFTVIDKADGFPLMIVFNLVGVAESQSKDADPITTIGLWKNLNSQENNIILKNTPFNDPNLAEIINSMGSPTYLAQEEAVLHLIFQNPSVDIGTDYPDCKALDAQPFNLTIYAQLPEKAELIWSSHIIHTWRGFRACYRIDQP